MRRPLAFLVGLSLLLGAACSLRTQPPPGADGPTIYDLQNCANCHGKAGEGKSLGPPLRNLSEHWTSEALAAFLADPKPVVAKDARLQQLESEHSGKMDRYDNLDVDQRTVLANWLLGL